MDRILPFALTQALAWIALALSATASFPLDIRTRAVGPVREWSAADFARLHADRLCVKFGEGTDIGLASSRFIDAGGRDLSGVNAALATAGVREIRPIFPYDRATARAWKAEGERRSGRTGPDLSLWYVIRVEGGAAVAADLCNALNASPVVEIAHPEPVAELAVIAGAGAGAGAPAPEDVRCAAGPVSVQGASTRPGADRISAAGDDRLPTPDYSGQQGYLYDSPYGLDAPAAWALPGGTGAGGKFIDVELSWTENHEDFPFPLCFYQGGAPQSPQYEYEAHGTAVLGEVVAQPNGYGVTGFAPGLSGYGVVAISIGAYPVIGQYFMEAASQLDRGDVWLIELQAVPPGYSAPAPMEYWQVNYDVIWISSWTFEVICVEAGANGSLNLDDPSWGGIFDRNVRDSGAIMVGAGTPDGLTAEWFSNYGSRMDVHAWGSEIFTTGYGDLYDGGTLQTRYTYQFGGTSGASPMIVGAALCLQGIAREAYGSPLAPAAIRTILHETGVSHVGSRYIGPRPNLGPAAERVLEQAEDVADALPGRSALTVAPNPFRESVRIGVPASAGLRIFDAAGRCVRRLGGASASGGTAPLSWDGRDEAGRPLETGVYFLRLDEPEGKAAVKLLKAR